MPVDISQSIPSRTSGRGVRLYVSPSVKKALGEVGTHLDDHRYSPHCRGRIQAYIAREGTATDCPELDREDLSGVEAMLEGSFEPVPYDSPAWDREDVFLDAEMLADGTHPWPVPAIGDDDREAPAPAPADERWYREECLYGYE